MTSTDSSSSFGITGPRFDLKVGHLVVRLASIGVDESTMDEVGAALRPLRSDIVTA